MDEQMPDDQLEFTYSSSVPVRDVALKTYRKQWTIGGGERGSGIFVLIARHDDDDDDWLLTVQVLKTSIYNGHKKRTNPFISIEKSFALFHHTSKSTNLFSYPLHTTIHTHTCTLLIPATHTYTLALTCICIQIYIINTHTYSYRHAYTHKHYYT